MRLKPNVAHSQVTAPPPSPSINVAFVFPTDGTEWHGGRNYFRSLFRALHQLPAASVQPVAFVGARADVESFEFPPNVRVVRDTVFDHRSLKWRLNHIGWRAVGVPWLANRAILRHGIRIASHVKPCPRNRKLKSIGWIPDFQHLHLPQFFSTTEIKNRTVEFLGLLARSDLVVVSSEAARRDLETFAPAFAEKARVLHFSALSPATQTSSVDVRAAYDLRNAPYFYIPNQAWAHKNHLTAIRALAEVRLEFPDAMIVCSGALTDYRNPSHLSMLRAQIEQHGLAKQFVFLGVVPYEHIAPLMLHAVATINPSLFEGWSTTVEEGKALGVPMILSDIDVHREQCTPDEADFFDPLDPPALAERLRSRLRTPGTTGTAPARNRLEEHRLRSLEFARAYCRIVEELDERESLRQP